MENGYYKISIFDLLEPEKQAIKGFSYREVRKYIEEQYKRHIDYKNSFMKNIVMGWLYPTSLDECCTVKNLDDEFKRFKKIYSSFNYHFQNEKITIMSYKISDVYRVLIIPANDDLVLEPSFVKDLFKDDLCAPACAIEWYNKDGTRNYGEYLTGKQNESWTLPDEIKKPVDSKESSFTEYYKDRRQYYFFNILQVHKYGKRGRVSNMKYDCFTNYSWKLTDMIQYFGG